MQNVGPLYGSAGRSPCCETTNQVSWYRRVIVGSIASVFSKKPSSSASNNHYQGHEIINEILNFKPSWLPAPDPVQMAVTYVDSAGKKRVKGGRDLKNSQSYPTGFCPQLFHIRKQCQKCYHYYRWCRILWFTCTCEPSKTTWFIIV
jgi:hypothetical protein